MVLPRSWSFEAISRAWALVSEPWEGVNRPRVGG